MGQIFYKNRRQNARLFVVTSFGSISKLITRNIDLVFHMLACENNLYRCRTNIRNNLFLEFNYRRNTRKRFNNISNN